MSGYSHDISVALTTSAATTPEIPYGGVDRAFIFIPTGSSITTLTFHAAPAMSETYLAAQERIYLATGGTDALTSQAITMTVAAAKSYQLPPTLSGAGAIRIVADAAGTVGLSFTFN